MEYKEFEEKNMVLGEGQENVEKLPVHISEENLATYCIKLSEREIEHILKSGEIWVRQIVGRNQQLDAAKILTEKPEMEEVIRPLYQKEILVATYNKIYKCVIATKEAALFVAITKGVGEIPFDLDFEDTKKSGQTDKKSFKCDIIESEEMFQEKWSEIYKKGSKNYIDFTVAKEEKTKLKIVE